MSMNKRDFLKITGIAAAGVAAGTKRAKASKQAEPATGKRLAMVVDSTKCVEGCEDCINACHSYHNVPDFSNSEFERIRNQEIKWIWKDGFENTFMVPEKEMRMVSEKVAARRFITLCNHCDNPPCVRVCPTQATFKRKSDGIVMMDFHRCIGCRFCMAGCPYGSRSFNFWDPTPNIPADSFNPEFPTRMKGVVEKCDFCAERLRDDKEPACVLACKQGALVFGDLNDPHSEVAKIVKSTFVIKRKPELGTLPMVYYIV